MADSYTVAGIGALSRSIYDGEVAHHSCHLVHLLSISCAFAIVQKALYFVISFLFLLARFSSLFIFSSDERVITRPNYQDVALSDRS
jgi:hypothetical protein